MNNKIIVLVTIFGLLGFSANRQVSDNWAALNEGQTIDDYSRKDNKIFCGEVACDVKPMEGIDIETFKVWPGSKYAKDKKQVYYPLQIICVDYTNCGVCKCTKIVIQNANPTTFQYLDKDYAKDDQTVFFRGEPITQADAKSFRVLKGPKYFYFAVDNKKVYLHNTIFKEADAETFYYDSLNKENNQWTFTSIVGDKNSKWTFSPPYQLTKIKE